MSKKIEKKSVEELLDRNGVPKITQEVFYVIIRDEMGLGKITVDIGLTVKDFTEKLESLQETYKEIFDRRLNGEEQEYNKEYKESYGDILWEEEQEKN
jgi:hypothetical protein